MGYYKIFTKLVILLCYSTNCYADQSISYEDIRSYIKTVFDKDRNGGKATSDYLEKKKTMLLRCNLDESIEIMKHVENMNIAEVYLFFEILMQADYGRELYDKFHGSINNRSRLLVIASILHNDKILNGHELVRDSKKFVTDFIKSDDFEMKPLAASSLNFLSNSEDETTHAINVIKNINQDWVKINKHGFPLLIEILEKNLKK